jgi:hypothetical protein
MPEVNPPLYETLPVSDRILLFGETLRVHQDEYLPRLVLVSAPRINVVCSCKSSGLRLETLKNVKSYSCYSS